MPCPKAGSLVFLSLVLMTAGFVLSLAGWFAPPITQVVIRVRLAGPSAFLVGLFLLSFSCCVCAFEQRKCCICCYPGGFKGDDDDDDSNDNDDRKLHSSPGEGTFAGRNMRKCYSSAQAQSHHPWPPASCHVAIGETVNSNVTPLRNHSSIILHNEALDTTLPWFMGRRRVDPGINHSLPVSQASFRADELPESMPGEYSRSFSSDIVSAL